MIQEQITTSAPRCLDGNAGFGVVAQTAGMAPNVAQEIKMLGGYNHPFPPGDPKNPVAFLHVLRRIGSINYHVLSRIADCGQDYSGRSNRTAHHLIFEERDTTSYAGGPSALMTQPNLYKTRWEEPPQEFSAGKNWPNPSSEPRPCTLWKNQLGDAGWAGVVAERIEKGDPISILFQPEMNVLPLLEEVFALLPPALRWKTTFSTFFMKSQEGAGARIQLKCFLIGSPEAAYARMSPNTLVIDLSKRPTEQPQGKYVRLAQNGPEIQQPKSVPLIATQTAQETQPAAETDQIFELLPSLDIPTQTTTYQPVPRKTKKKGSLLFWLTLTLLPLLIITIAVAAVLFITAGDPLGETAKVTAQKQAEDEQKKAEEAAAEQKAKEEEEQRKAEEAAAQKAKEEEQKAQEEAARKAQEEAEKKAQEEAEKKAKEEAQKAQEEAEKKAQEEADKKAKEEETAKIDELKKQKYWFNIPDASRDRQAVLPQSEFLFELKDKVKIFYTPFVDLKQSPNPFRKGSILAITYKSEGLYQINFFADEQSIGQVEGEDKKYPIATIKLEPNGLSFQWLKVDKYDTNETRQIINRILLAKLKIEIEGNDTVNLALLAPVQYTPKEFKERPSEKGIPLWGPDSKQYIVVPNDKASMLIDFNEAYREPKAKDLNKEESEQRTKISLVQPKAYHKTTKSTGSLCYGPKLKLTDNLEGYCVIQSNPDLSINIDFLTKEIEDLMKRLEQANEEYEASQILKANETKQVRDWRRELKKLLDSRSGQVPNDSNLMNEINRLQTNILNYDNSPSPAAQKLNEAINKVTKAKEALNKMKAKLQNLTLDKFSIYLLPDGTEPTDIRQSRRLLLFEVTDKVIKPTIQKTNNTPLSSKEPSSGTPSNHQKTELNDLIKGLNF